MNIIKKVDFDRSKTVFVVGRATGAAARDAGFSSVLGEDSGSANRLAPIIIDHFAGADASSTRLLFPGAKRKMGGLTEKISPIEVVDVPVYETCGRPREELAAELSKIPIVDFVVFFSPSGVKAALEVIKSHSPSSKLVAIGLTTAKFLDNPIVSASPEVQGKISLDDSSVN